MKSKEKQEECKVPKLTKSQKVGSLEQCKRIEMHRIKQKGKSNSKKTCHQRIPKNQKEIRQNKIDILGSNSD